MIIGRRHPANCFVCGRRPDGLGYAPGRASVAWTCQEHIAMTKAAYHMPRTRLDAFEQQALGEAGAAMGAYLEDIGETDLARLTPEQFVTATKILLEAFQDATAAAIDQNRAPF